MCGLKAVTVHEIVPKSKRPKNWRTVDNCVAICHSCHSWAHSLGYRHSKDDLEFMRDKRRKELGLDELR